MSRATVDKALGKMGLAGVCTGKSDREVYEMWTALVGTHRTLLELRTHLACTMPHLPIDAYLTPPEQRALFAVLEDWHARFA